jgi:replicative DNA helicase
MGKTAFVVQAAVLAARQGVEVDFFSLEMSSEQLSERFIKCIAGVESFGKSNLQQAIDAANEFATLPIRIYENPAASALGIASQVRKSKPGLVIIDYLQLMDGPGDNRESQVAAISRACKTQIAMRCNVPVILLSQLNRSVESRTDKRPLLSDLRESGAIEQDADKVVMLYRDGYYMSDDKSDPGPCEFIVSKNRLYGGCGTVTLRYNPRANKFSEAMSY